MPGSHLVLVKNPSYWKPGKPYLDRIIYKIVPDANALLNQLETGDIDTRLRLVNEHVDVVKKLPNVTLVSTPSIVAVAPVDQPDGPALQRQEGAPGARPRLRQGAPRQDASWAAT